MTMPKAAVDEYYFSPLREDHVWFAGELGIMELVSVSASVSNGTNNNFGFGVSTPNARHPFATLSGSQSVHQRYF